MSLFSKSLHRLKRGQQVHLPQISNHHGFMFMALKHHFHHGVGGQGSVKLVEHVLACGL